LIKRYGLSQAGVETELVACAKESRTGNRVAIDEETARSRIKHRKAQLTARIDNRFEDDEVVERFRGAREKFRRGMEREAEKGNSEWDGKPHGRGRGRTRRGKRFGKQKELLGSDRVHI